ncbi:hypothetical protein [Methylobacterium sp. WL19]|uniref:hypothetical protein n=1 Tax=Methylobacterium sp. WL19 TaxID=2603896 RepID=UPI00164FBEA9|nr:hypothetical protein [Methylobacterium sp. WL19]
MIPAPSLVTTSVDPETGNVVIYGDGIPLLQVTQSSALWVLSRLAEALARSS